MFKRLCFDSDNTFYSDQVIHPLTFWELQHNYLQIYQYFECRIKLWFVWERLNKASRPHEPTEHHTCFDEYAVINQSVLIY